MSTIDKIRPSNIENLCRNTLPFDAVNSGSIDTISLHPFGDIETIGNSFALKEMSRLAEIMTPQIAGVDLLQRSHAEGVASVFAKIEQEAQERFLSEMAKSPILESMSRTFPYFWW